MRGIPGRNCHSALFTQGHIIPLRRSHSSKRGRKKKTGQIFPSHPQISVPSAPKTSFPGPWSVSWSQPSDICVKFAGASWIFCNWPANKRAPVIKHDVSGPSSYFFVEINARKSYVTSFQLYPCQARSLYTP
jgi:hypothetical protein